MYSHSLVGVPPPEEARRLVAHYDGVAAPRAKEWDGASLPAGHLDAINRLLARMGKSPVSAEDVLVRPVRLTGDQVTANYTKFDTNELPSIARKVPGIPLLVGHDTESLPLGTFYRATVTKDEEGNSWIDTWVFFVNDDEGKAVVERIDKGVYNEASIGWMYEVALCSVCNRDYWSGYPLKFFIANEDANDLSEQHNVCMHVAGETYKVGRSKQLCYMITKGVTPLEGSIVYRGAHPGTRVGGVVRASIEGPADEHVRRYAMASFASIVASERKGKSGWVPPNPLDYALDDSPNWEAPTLRDFTRKLGYDDDVRWEELPDGEQRWIARHFAWAPSPDPGDYTFSDLKLPHHSPGGTLVWGGVRAAAARLPQTEISEADKEKVRRHLERHYREFGKTPPWSQDAAIQEALEGQQEASKPLEVNMDELVATIESLTKEVASLRASIEKLTAERDALVAKLQEAEALALENLSFAEIGKAYLKSLAEEAVKLRVSLEGAEAAEAYEKVVLAWAEDGREDVLLAEVQRLRALKEKLYPAGRVSIEQPVDNDMKTMTAAVGKLSRYRVGK